MLMMAAMEDNKITTQSLALHHITIMGADRASSIEFWEGVLGMPFIFEQPNLDNPGESHLYFDPGDGRLITIFCDEARTAKHKRTPTDAGCVHHVAFAVAAASLEQVPDRLRARGIGFTGPKDRGFMHSIYFKDPLGLLIELACYTFEPPEGFTHSDVLLASHRVRVAAGDDHILRSHIATAIETLAKYGRESLSDD